MDDYENMMEGGMDSLSIISLICLYVLLKQLNTYLCQKDETHLGYGGKGVFQGTATKQKQNQKTNKFEL